MKIMVPLFLLTLPFQSLAQAPFQIRFEKDGEIQKKFAVDLPGFEVEGMKGITYERVRPSVVEYYDNWIWVGEEWENVQKTIEKLRSKWGIKRIKARGFEFTRLGEEEGFVTQRNLQALHAQLLGLESALSSYFSGHKSDLRKGELRLFEISEVQLEVQTCLLGPSYDLKGNQFVFTLDRNSRTDIEEFFLGDILSDFYHRHQTQGKRKIELERVASNSLIN